MGSQFRRWVMWLLINKSWEFGQKGMVVTMKLSFERRRELTGYVFLSPWLISAAVLLVFPLVFSLVLSFANLKNMEFNLSTMTFAGIKHYQQAFMIDVNFLPKFWNSVSNTLINTPMILVISLIIAIMVSRKIRFRGFFRSVFFLPVLLGTGFVMEQILGQNVDQQAMEVARGILLPEQIQAYIGPDVTAFIIGFFNRITVVMWKSGVQIIIALAGIQGISPALYESARVDGATEWEMFWKITLPMMSPILLLNAVYTVIASMTENSEVVDYIIEKMMHANPVQYEYASAMGWIYFLFILVFVLLIFLVMRPFVKKVADNSR